MMYLAADASTPAFKSRCTAALIRVGWPTTRSARGWRSDASLRKFLHRVGAAAE